MSLKEYPEKVLYRCGYSTSKIYTLLFLTSLLQSTLRSPTLDVSFQSSLGYQLSQASKSRV